MGLSPKPVALEALINLRLELKSKTRATVTTCGTFLLPRLGLRDLHQKGCSCLSHASQSKAWFRLEYKKRLGVESLLAASIRVGSYLSRLDFKSSRLGLAQKDKARFTSEPDFFRQSFLTPTFSLSIDNGRSREISDGDARSLQRRTCRDDARKMIPRYKKASFRILVCFLDGWSLFGRFFNWSNETKKSTRLKRSLLLMFGRIETYFVAAMRILLLRNSTHLKSAIEDVRFST